MNWKDKTIKSWEQSQSDSEKREIAEIQRAEKLRRQREREETIAELTIRRIEMILLDRMGINHVNFIQSVGTQVRKEFGF